MSCNMCNDRGEDGQLSAASKLNRDRWACDTTRAADSPVMLLDGDRRMPLLRCPFADSVPRYKRVIPILAMARKQYGLPVAGGMLDQAAQFVTALLCYDACMMRIEVAEQEKARSKARMKDG